MASDTVVPANLERVLIMVNAILERTNEPDLSQASVTTKSRQIRGRDSSGCRNLIFLSLTNCSSCAFL